MARGRAVTALVDVDVRDLPVALARLHRATPVGGELVVRLVDPGPTGFPLADLVDGAGFAAGDAVVRRDVVTVVLTRLRTLPDGVGPGLRLLVCGLNPSLYAADAGVPFARPGNRFWPAALASGLVERDRDPDHALGVDRVGFTDLVKRATPRADELAPDELAVGGARLERMAGWLAPAAVCFLGLTGYRAAFDRSAVAGWQPRGCGGRPAYLMPNPSGLNAHATPATLAAHLRTALAGP